MPDLLAQLLPLAPTPLVAFIPSNTVRYIALGFAVVYFGGCVVRPGLPSVKMKQLEEYIEETSKIYAKAIRELERNPLFAAQAGLQLAQVKFSESVLRSKTLGAKDVAWRDYFEHLRCLSFYIDECQRQAREVRTSVLLALEADRQKRYMEDIAQRRTTLDTTAFPRGSAYDPISLSSCIPLDQPAERLPLRSTLPVDDNYRSFLSSISGP